jgi:hypothetical protein
VTRHLGATRRSLFEEIDYLALKHPPPKPHEFAEWKLKLWEELQLGEFWGTIC